MNKLLSCRYNMDTNRVEARFEDGTILSIDCIAIEDTPCFYFFRTVHSYGRSAAAVSV